MVIIAIFAHFFFYKFNQIIYEKVSCAATQPKRSSSRQTIYILNKIVHLQSSLDEVNLTIIACSYFINFARNLEVDSGAKIVEFCTQLKKKLYSERW